MGCLLSPCLQTLVLIHFYAIVLIFIITVSLVVVFHFNVHFSSPIQSSRVNMSEWKKPQFTFLCVSTEQQIPPTCPCNVFRHTGGILPRMPEYARVCQGIPTYARVCQSMPEYARVCQSMQ